MSDTTDNDRGLLPFDEDQVSETIRRVWHEERWFFSVIDVVGLLIENQRPRKYWSDLKVKLRAQEDFRDVLAKCKQLKVPAPDGKMRETDCADFVTMVSLLFSLPAWHRRHVRHLSEPDDVVSQDNCNSGIYAITNVLTRERYIGSSNNISARFNQHKALLRQGKHHAKYLQEAWVSFGEDAFCFEILEELSDTQLLEVIEQRYLDDERPIYNNARTAHNNSSLPQIAPERFRRVLHDLYEMGGFGTSSPIYRTIRDAMLMGALRPGPNFSLILEAEQRGAATCEELSGFFWSAQEMIA